MKVSASPGAEVTFDLFDVNNLRYGFVSKRINATGGVFTFVFDKTPGDKGFDFTKVACVLINVSNMVSYNGTITISELKIGDKAVGAPAPTPAAISIGELKNRTVFTNTPSVDVQLDSVAVIKDGVMQTTPITMSISSSNTSLIPNPALPTIINAEGVLKLIPNANQTGKSTITITTTATGLTTKVVSFEVNVLAKNNGAATTIDIKQGETFQTISGIGTVSENMEESVGDLGASMLRFDMGAEYQPGLEGAENDNSDPFVLDVTKFKFTDRYDFKKAYDLGCKRIIAAVWTPPYWMKGIISPRPQFPVEPNVLLPDFYDEFAEYIVGSCIAFKNTYGFEMYSICLQNEAEFGASGNLTGTCQYTKETAAEVVRRVYPRLKAAGLTTRIHGFDQLFAQGQVLNWFKYFNDNDTKDMFDAFSFHAYSADAATIGDLVNADLQSAYAEAQRVNPKKELWMTETSGEPNNEAGGMYQIATQMSVYTNNLSAWVNFGVDAKGGMKYYAYKNFTKFIKPGAVRMGTTNANGIAGLAFKNDAEKTYTVVLSNVGTTDQQVKLGGTAGMPSKMYAYTTSYNINCMLTDTVKSSDNYMVYVPAKSVVTLSSKYEDVTTANEENIASNFEMVIYPNPSRGELNVTLPNASFKEFAVLDITGRVVLTKAIKANGIGQERIDLSGLQKGIYIITAKGETTLREKVIVE